MANKGKLAGFKMLDIRVSGRVQGVGFRACAQDRALELGLRGWVRNSDEDVELSIAGFADEVDRMVAWCRMGPPLARVDEVLVSTRSLEMEERDFRITW